MKRGEIRALANEVYAILDDADADVAVLRAMEVLSNAPKDIESFLLLSEVFEEKGHFDQALSWINQGLDYHPTHEALLLKKASILMDGFDELDEAFLLLKRIEEAFGDKSLSELKIDYDEELLIDVFLLLTDCYRLKNDFKEAFHYAQRALEVVPNDEVALLSLATAYYELGNFSKALELLNVENAKEKGDYFWILGQVHCGMGNFEAADQYFFEASKSDRSRYHRPIRVSESIFFACFEQATMALPKEIRDFLHKSAVFIKPIIALDVIKDSEGKVAPSACIVVDKRPGSSHALYLFQKNIENLAHKKSEIRDLIASALLHELGTIITRT